MSEPIIAIADLCFAWDRQMILDLPEFEISKGEKIFLRGPSGSGKSTLLALLTGIASPQQGKLEVLDRELTALTDAQRDRLRADHFGIIFQMFNLLPYLSGWENVLLPAGFSSRRAERARRAAGSVTVEAKRLLESLRIDPAIADQSAHTLSVGQQQRIAAARALLGAPELIVADEPTSALDSDGRSRFIELLIAECERYQSSLLFVSHDQALAHHFDRALELNELNRVERARS